MKKLLLFSFLPASADLALLVLRIWFGLLMVVNHGWGKLIGFPERAAKFSDPLGVGSHTSLALAVLGEVFCSVLLILGLGTRLAALGSLITMAVAFFLSHGGKLSGPGSGEMAFLYLGAFVVLFIAGAGRFSLDKKFGAS